MRLGTSCTSVSRTLRITIGVGWALPTLLTYRRVGTAPPYYPSSQEIGKVYSEIAEKSRFLLLVSASKTFVTLL